MWNINSNAEYLLQIITPFRMQYEQACDRIRTERTRLLKELESVPFLKVYPSHANYFLCELVSGLSAADLARTLLAKHGILIKDLTGKEGFERGQFIRVAVRNEADNRKLVGALSTLG